MQTPWTGLRIRASSLREAERLRAVGTLVLAAGVVGASIFYWIHAPLSTPALDDSSALGYSRAMERQMGTMMGSFGVTMMEWQGVLDRPSTKAIIIVAVSALFAAYFFRSAWVLDENERDRRRSAAAGGGSNP